MTTQLENIKIEGLNELIKAREAASDEQDRYEYEFTQAMTTGSICRPEDKTLQKKANELTLEYPRAAIYLQAQAYTRASNDRKYSAGEEAMELIVSGGSLDDANEILKNWLRRN